MNITIQNAEATVTCRTHGAELLSYKTAAGKEYMWQKDPAYWAKTSPVLFPYIGAVPETVTIHGTEYAIPRHGFVKDVEFDVAEQGDDYVVLSTGTSDFTKPIYPYDFRFTVTFRLKGPALEVTYGVFNLGNEEMPFLIGGHPAFFCPMEDGEQFTDYMLRFEDENVRICTSSIPCLIMTPSSMRILPTAQSDSSVPKQKRASSLISRDTKAWLSGLPSKKTPPSSASNRGVAEPWIRFPARIC